MMIMIFLIPGKYEVMFKADIMDYIDGKNIMNVLKREREEFSPYLGVVSNTLEIRTHESLAPKPMKAPIPCTTTERNQLVTAGNAQRTMSGYGLDEANRRETETYLTWMGAFANGRHTKVANCISTITDSPQGPYACDDEPNVFAYVYPSDKTHTIYVCGAFWKAPVSGGFDTRAGTLIHELSHFDDICDTNDWVYGVNGAKNLARTNPDRAVNNADNYEYFCESVW